MLFGWGCSQSLAIIAPFLNSWAHLFVDGSGCDGFFEVVPVGLFLENVVIMCGCFFGGSRIVFE